MAIEKLTPKMRKAAEVYLLVGDTAVAAAEAGVGVRAVQRWLHTPVFRDYLDTLIAETRRDTRLARARLRKKATDALERLLDKSEFRAVKLHLDHDLADTERDELVTRLDRIESRLLGGGE